MRHRNNGCIHCYSSKWGVKAVLLFLPCCRGPITHVKWSGDVWRALLSGQQSAGGVGAEATALQESESLPYKVTSTAAKLCFCETLKGSHLQCRISGLRTINSDGVHNKFSHCSIGHCLIGHYVKVLRTILSAETIAPPRKTYIMKKFFIT